MQDMTEVFIELGCRLRGFGSDERSRRCIAEAVRDNEWFRPEDVRMAAEAICEEFLDGAKLRRWLSHYDLDIAPRRVALIMAGNIPFVGFFDMMCVLLCGHRACVKTSRKDSATMGYIIEQLSDICGNIEIEKYDDGSTFDMVIATGGDAAATHFRSRFSDVPALIRGSRHSVAVLAGDESREEMEGLRRDIFSYSGLGCRSVSSVFVPRGCRFDLDTPADTNPMYRDNYAYTRAMLAMGGVPFVDKEGYVAVESRGFSDALSRVNYSFYDSTAEVEAWLAEHDDDLQCVVSRCVDHPRRVDFGRAQYPTLRDYADGVDVMEFLTK